MLNAEAARLDMERLKGSVTQVSGELAAMNQAARQSGSATAEQTARIKELQKALRELKSDYRSASADYESLRTASSPGGGHGGNKQSLAHSGRAIMDMTLAGQSPLQAAAMEAPRTIQAFNGGLGTMLGVGMAFSALHKIGESISEVIAEARKLKDGLEDALRPDPTRGTQGIEALRQKVRALDVQIEEARPKLGIFERGGQWVGNYAQGAMTAVSQGIFNSPENPLKRVMHGAGSAMVGDMAGVGKAVFGGSVTMNLPIDKNVELREESERRRRKALDEIIEATKHENDLKEKGFHHGEMSVKLAEIELQKRHELAAMEEGLGIPDIKKNMRKVQDDLTITDSRKEGRLAQLQKELDEKQRAANALATEIERMADHAAEVTARELKNKEAAVALENKLTEAKRGGVAVEVKAAEARLENAKKIRDAGPASGVERAANLAKVKAAEWELHLAGRARTELLAQLEIERQMAEFRGTADQKHLLALHLQSQEMKRQLSSPAYGADEKQKIGVNLAQNAMERVDATRAVFTRGNQAYLSGVEATQGRGPDEQRRILEERLKVAQAELDANTAGTDESGNPVAKKVGLYNEQINAIRQIKMAADDVRYAEEKSLDALKAQTREMELQQKGMVGASKLEQIRAQYAPRIAEAERNNLPEEAEQLRKQQRGAERSAMAADEAKGPGGRLAEQRRAREEQRAADRAEKRLADSAKLTAERNAANDSMSGKGLKGKEHMAKPGHMPDRSIKAAGVQPDRRASVNAAAAPFKAATNVGKDFQGALAGVETLLKSIDGKVTFKGL